MGMDELAKSNLRKIAAQLDRNGLSTRTDLCTDAEFSGRYHLFHMADGTVVDGRQFNWRQVMWDRVVKIELIMKNDKYEFDSINFSNFKGFLTYKGFTIVSQEDNKGKFVPMKEPWWAVGWTNGTECFMTRISVATGKVVKEHTAMIYNISGHIHPRLWPLLSHQDKFVGV